jgi:hypothetical protein
LLVDKEQDPQELGWRHNGLVVKGRGAVHQTGAGRVGPRSDPGESLEVPHGVRLSEPRWPNTNEFWGPIVLPWLIHPALWDLRRPLRPNGSFVANTF